jgi:GDPmannose 4,6-dehydratase
MLFNHSSPRRGLEFVERKVTYHAAKIALGLAKEIRIGNLDSQRDWGFAGDYVEAMWLMLQQDKPEDFVISSGTTHLIRRVLELAFNCVDLNWQDYAVQDERFMRPAEVDLLVGDSSKAHQILKWQPHVNFEQMIEMMVKADYDALKAEHNL